MLELLFLLLPAAATYGWYMGRKNTQQNQQQESKRFSREYVGGLNFLLSNYQQNKAVDIFLNMVKEESNSFEVHLTLGNLFCFRGEVDQAIRIHQTLMKSTSLTLQQRLLTIQQLGKDYMMAGFYDRAEDMFIQLVNEDDFRISALNVLLQIHQSTSEWLKAIDVAEKLVKLGKNQCRVEIAHFYCELALQAIKRDDMQHAFTLLKRGESIDKNSARVSIIYARIFIAAQDYTNAIGVLQKVLYQDREIVSETLPMLQKCYKALNQPDSWVNFLKRCVEENIGSVAELFMTDIIEREQGSEMAQSYINQQLRKHPTLHMFHRLISIHLREVEEDRAKERLQILRDMLVKQIYTKPNYRCYKCGFTSHSLYWHCPSCRSWSSIKPIRGLDGQ